MGRGQAYITKPPLKKFEWPLIELPLPDGMPIVVLPLRFGQPGTLIGISKYPVTVRAYRRFVAETGHREPITQIYKGGIWVEEVRVFDDPRFRANEKPIVGVSKDDAFAYLSWLRRLLGPSSKTFSSLNLPLVDFFRLAVAQKISSLVIPPASSFAERFGTELRSVRELHPNSLGIAGLGAHTWHWTGTVGDWSSEFRRDNVRVSVKRIFNEIPYDPSVPQEEVLFGGSFYDQDLSAKETASVSDLPEGVESRHSDLGFRVAACLKADVCGQLSFELLEVLPKFASKRLYLGASHNGGFSDELNETALNPGLGVGRRKLDRDISNPP